MIWGPCNYLIPLVSLSLFPTPTPIPIPSPFLFLSFSFFSFFSLSLSLSYLHWRLLDETTLLNKLVPICSASALVRVQRTTIGVKDYNYHCLSSVSFSSCVGIYDSYFIWCRILCLQCSILCHELAGVRIWRKKVINLDRINGKLNECHTPITALPSNTMQSPSLSLLHIPHVCRGIAPLLVCVSYGILYTSQ